MRKAIDLFSTLIELDVEVELLEATDELSFLEDFFEFEEDLSSLEAKDDASLELDKADERLSKEDGESPFELLLTLFPQAEISKDAIIELKKIGFLLINSPLQKDYFILYKY